MSLHWTEAFSPQVELCNLVCAQALHRDEAEDLHRLALQHRRREPLCSLTHDAAVVTNVEGRQRGISPGNLRDNESSWTPHDIAVPQFLVVAEIIY